jgi:hypothetical protein
MFPGWKYALAGSICDGGSVTKTRTSKAVATAVATNDNALSSISFPSPVPAGKSFAATCSHTQAEVNSVRGFDCGSLKIGRKLTR